MDNRRLRLDAARMLLTACDLLGSPVDDDLNAMPIEELQRIRERLIELSIRCSSILDMRTGDRPGSPDEGPSSSGRRRVPVDVVADAVVEMLAEFGVDRDPFRCDRPRLMAAAGELLLALDIEPHY